MKHPGFICKTVVLLILLSGFLPDPILHSQPLTQEQFIKGCATYRSVVVHDIIDVFIKFNAFSDSLKAISDFPEGHQNLKANFANYLLKHFSKAHSSTFNCFKFEGPGMEKEFSGYYVQWIGDNNMMLHEYSIMVQKEFIESRYPYKLLTQENFWREVEFFNLQAGETLVDIGTGTGYFPLIIALSGIKVDFFLTEINDYYIEFARVKCERLDSAVYPARLVVINGKTKDTNLGAVKADKIIIRETFHHFNFPGHMLRSIKEHLKPSGSVFVSEGVTEFSKGVPDSCYKMISRKKIIKSFQKEGYCLKQDQRNGTDALLEFVYWAD